MNQLANRIFTFMSPFGNFLLGNNADKLNIDFSTRMDTKMFFVVQSMDQDNKSKKEQRSKSNSSNHYTSVSELKIEYSINDLIAATDKDLAGKIFSMDKTLSGQNIDEMIGNNIEFKDQIKDLQAMKNVNLEHMATFKFFKVSKSQVQILEGESTKYMLAFVDISQKILYNTAKAQTELLSLINSTISHEMRNPLNSIINECKIQQIMIFSLQQLMSTCQQMMPPDIFSQTVDVIQKLMRGNKVQKSSSELLMLNVEDILGYAQIKNNRFTKHLKPFNIKRSVQDIMEIQEY